MKITSVSREATGPIVANATEGGLCNRLKVLLSCMRMCEYARQELQLYWPSTPLCNCSFSLLFENNFSRPNAIPSAPDDDYYWRLWVHPDDVPMKFAKVYPSATGQDIDFEYDRIPIQVRDTYLKYVNQLIPVFDIRERVRAFAARMTDRTIGVHVRRTDNLESWRRPGTNEDFHLVMDAFLDGDAGVTFLLCTDCASTQDKFQRRYGDRLLIYPKRNYERSNPSGIQDALVDLLLLSKASRLVASYLSTFSELAWWFGQCRQKVCIVQRKSSWRSMRLITSRFLGK